jgi:hypothetical protein
MTKPRLFRAAIVVGAALVAVPMISAAADVTGDWSY